VIPVPTKDILTDYLGRSKKGIYLGRLKRGKRERIIYIDALPDTSIHYPRVLKFQRPESKQKHHY
jgi:hypothetical protein